MELTTVELGGDAKAFSGPGREMLITTEHNGWAYSPSGDTYGGLVVVRDEPSFVKGMLRRLRTCEDPHRARVVRLFTSGPPEGVLDVVELDGVGYSKAPLPSAITLLALPSMRSPVHLFRRLSTGHLIYLSCDRYATDTENPSFKLFMGRNGDLHEVQIEFPRPEPDGWWSSYPTEHGTLEVPLEPQFEQRFSPKYRRRVPQWNGEPLDVLMHELFRIVETGSNVSLALNRGH